MYSISREQGVAATVAFAGAAAFGATGVQAAPPVSFFPLFDAYIGVEPEVGQSTNQFTHPVIHGSSNTDFAGMGLTAGADYKFLQRWVVGVQGFYDWNVASGGPAFVNGVSVDTETNWQAGAQGRLGFLLAPQVLVFGTAGYQWKNEEIIFDTSFSHTVGQMFYGGGVEYAASPRVHLDLQVTVSQDSNTVLFFGDLPATFHDVTAKAGIHVALYKK
jgi:hypothetical protein